MGGDNSPKEPIFGIKSYIKEKTDKNTLLLHTNMDVGHGGASGRFDALKETAIDYTFLLAEIFLVTHSCLFNIIISVSVQKC